MHITVFVLAMRNGVVKALGVIPSLFCISRRSTLGSWSVRQLEVVILTLVLPLRDRLHMQATRVHLVLLPLFVLGHLYV